MTDFDQSVGDWTISSGASLTNDRLVKNSGRLMQLNNDGLIRTGTFDLSDYESVKLDLILLTNNTPSNGLAFTIGQANNGSASYESLRTWVLGTDFHATNYTGVRRGVYTATPQIAQIEIPGPFTSQTSFKINCSAYYSRDYLLIDDIRILGCTASKPCEADPNDWTNNICQAYQFQVLQPDCNSDQPHAGTVNLHMQLDANWAYSMDDGQTFQPSFQFNEVKTGDYHIVVKDMDTDCACRYENYTIHMDACEDPQALVEEMTVSVSQHVNCLQTDPRQGILQLTLPEGAIEKYTFRLEGPTARPHQAVTSFKQLEAGDYQLWIKQNTTDEEVLYPKLISIACLDMGGEDQTTCAGGCVTIGGAGSSDYCYTWDADPEIGEGERYTQNPVVCPMVTTTYRVNVTDGEGAIWRDEVTVWVDNVVDVTPTTATLCDDPIVLNAEPGFDQYEWTKDGVVIANGNSPQLEVNEAGTYSIKASKANGTCEATGAAMVSADNQDVLALLEANGFYAFEGILVNDLPGITDDPQSPLTLRNPPGEVPLESSCTEVSFEYQGNTYDNEVLAATLYENIKVVEAYGIQTTVRIADLSCLCAPDFDLDSWMASTANEVAALAFVYDAPDGEEDVLMVRYTSKNVLDLFRLYERIESTDTTSAIYCKKCSGSTRSSSDEEISLSLDVKQFKCIAATIQQDDGKILVKDNPSPFYYMGSEAESLKRGEVSNDFPSIADLDLQQLDTKDIDQFILLDNGGVEYKLCTQVNLDFDYCNDGFFSPENQETINRFLDALFNASVGCNQNGPITKKAVDVNELKRQLGEIHEWLKDKGYNGQYFLKNGNQLSWSIPDGVSPPNASSAIMNDRMQKFAEGNFSQNFWVWINIDDIENPIVEINYKKNYLKPVQALNGNNHSPEEFEAVVDAALAAKLKQIQITDFAYSDHNLAEVGYDGEASTSLTSALQYFAVLYEEGSRLINSGTVDEPIWNNGLNIERNEDLSAAYSKKQFHIHAPVAAVFDQGAEESLALLETVSLFCDLVNDPVGKSTELYDGASGLFNTLVNLTLEDLQSFPEDILQQINDKYFEGELRVRQYHYSRASLGILAVLIGGGKGKFKDLIDGLDGIFGPLRKFLDRIGNEAVKKQITNLGKDLRTRFLNDFKGPEYDEVLRRFTEGMVKAWKKVTGRAYSTDTAFFRKTF